MPIPLNDGVRRRAHAVVSSMSAHRIFLYAVASLAAVSIAILNAMRNYSNFYSIAIYLSKSSRSVLVLANFGILLTLMSGHLVQRIFFGSLRPNEVERLYDRLWFFITESLLAFTIFRDEFDIPFALMFGFLLFIKSFHWLSGDRIEWMDQRPYPGPGKLFHLRMATLFVILWTIDLIMFVIAIENTIAHGVGGMILFASEYGILMASIGNVIAKYLLSTYELYRAARRGGENAPAWENKSMWLFYIELATDFIKLTTYLVFFTVIITFYGLPLNIIRDVYITARSFVTRLRALHRYKTATKNMDQRYPNATEEEMMTMTDRTCIICREEMILNQVPATQPADGPNTTPKKLPCGHIFHFHCLRSWLERQQSCPTCRRTVLDNTPVVPAPPLPRIPPADNANVVDNNPPINRPIPGDPIINNPGNGLVNRIFGPPPNQAPPPATAPAAPPVATASTGNQQPSLVIQYNIQYDIGRQAEPTQAPQPAPIFQGFHGPGGVWQPWPTPGRQDIPAPQHETGQGPNGMSNDDNSSTSSSSSPSSPQDTFLGETNPLSPQEAARAATLRRFKRQQQTTDNDHDATENSSGSSTAVRAAPSLPSSSSAQPTPPASNLPKLIPLRSSGITHSPLLAPSTVPQTTGSHSGRPQDQGAPSLSQLPPILTDEQLRMMDNLTRESLDERLRVLEGVSTAVYRCIDELMRMRSALPSQSTERSAAPPSQGAPNQRPAANPSDSDSG